MQNWKTQKAENEKKQNKKYRLENIWDGLKVKLAGKT